MLTQKQMTEVEGKMLSAGYFRTAQVQEWMVEVTGDRTSGWTAAAQRLIWQAEKADRIFYDGNDQYLVTDAGRAVLAGLSH